MALPRPLVRALVLLLGLLLGLVAGGAAQVPYLVADIATGATGTGGSDASADPEDLVTVRSHLFFTAREPSSGRELWVTDGTAVGTEMLADACPGSCDSNPRVLGALGGTVLFWARPSEVGNNLLWRSDGTRTGTFPLTSSGAPIQVYTNALFHGALYFEGCGAGGSCELWRTDGTQAGTRLAFDTSGHQGIRDLAAAPGHLFFLTGDRTLWSLDAGGPARPLLGLAIESPLNPGSLVISGDRLFFSNGGNLWTSDGTAAGTRPITGAGGLPALTALEDLQAVGGRVYFFAPSGDRGSRLWVSDGTTAGTRPLTRPVTLHSNLHFIDDLPIFDLAGRIVFFAVVSSSGPYSAWVADGNPNSATQLSPAPVDFNHPPVQVGSRLLFVSGSQLWASDGTVAGTGAITRHCGCGGSLAGPRVVGTRAYFAGGEGAGRRGLWQTDGTEAGTRRAAASGDWSAGDGDGLEIAAFRNRLYFDATSSYGNELWSASGAAGDPADLVANLAVGAPSANPSFLTALGERVVFAACDDPSASFIAHLWASAGAAETTLRLSASPTFSCFPNDPFLALRNLGTARGLLFFTDGSPNLFRTDGTPDGTFPLTSFAPGSAPLGTAAVLGDRLFFLVASGGQGALWTSDGTVAGTGPAFALPEPALGIGSLWAAGSRLYLGVINAARSFTLWASDGTAAGTHQVVDLGEGSIGFTAPLGSSLLFLFQPAANNDDPALWASDGTAAGTLQLRPHFRRPSDPSSAELSGALYFFDGGGELWRSDGTPQGTAVVRQFDTSAPLPTSELTAFAGRLYFTAADPEHGAELWTSDGTAAGTLLFADLLPGSRSSQSSALRVAGGRLYFSADDGVHGRELWATNGTAAGTVLVADLAPEGASSAPTELTVVGDRLYFSADDGLVGRELWALPLTGGGCQPGETRLCLSGGRFQVEVEWKDFQGRTGVGHAVPLTADTGSFWFFNSANLELIVKVLDARTLNGAFWVFYGALSNVEYTIVVTDTQTGLTRRYFNPAGRFASVGDTRGFGPAGEFSSRSARGEGGAPAVPAAAASGCEAGPTRLCLQGGRFAVEASWRDFQGRTGVGTAVNLSGDTGSFWFFGPDNLEVLVKVLDGSGLNGKFWFFYGALSNVEYTLTVTDTATGKVRTYRNPSGQFASAGDTNAFE